MSNSRPAHIFARADEKFFDSIRQVKVRHNGQTDFLLDLEVPVVQGPPPNWFKMLGGATLTHDNQSLIVPVNLEWISFQGSCVTARLLRINGGSTTLFDIAHNPFLPIASVTLRRGKACRTYPNASSLDAFCKRSIPSDGSSPSNS